MHSELKILKKSLEWHQKLAGCQTSKNKLFIIKTPLNLTKYHLMKHVKDRG